MYELYLFINCKHSLALDKKQFRKKRCSVRIKWPHGIDTKKYYILLFANCILH